MSCAVYFLEVKRDDCGTFAGRKFYPLDEFLQTFLERNSDVIISPECWPHSCDLGLGAYPKRNRRLAALFDRRRPNRLATPPSPISSSVRLVVAKNRSKSRI